MRPIVTGSILLLLVGLSGVASCAGRRLYEPSSGGGGTQLVSTDEPLERVAEPSLPPQPIDSSHADPLLAAMAHMVANDGAWRPLVWRGIGGFGGRRCWSGASIVATGALATIDPRPALAQGWWSRRWVYVGLTFDPGAEWVGLQVAPCHGAYSTSVVASRGGLLAPSVTGRDTSVLFTTRRANASAPPGAGIVDAVIEQFVTPRAADGEARKAMPRIRPRG